MARKHDQGNERNGSNAPVNRRDSVRMEIITGRWRHKTESAIMRVAYGEHSKDELKEYIE